MLYIYINIYQYRRSRKRVYIIQCIDHQSNVSIWCICVFFGPTFQLQEPSSFEAIPSSFEAIPSSFEAIPSSSPSYSLSEIVDRAGPSNYCNRYAGQICTPRISCGRGLLLHFHASASLDADARRLYFGQMYSL